MTAASRPTTATSTSSSTRRRPWAEAARAPAEQLFAAGYSACFQGALGVVARQEKADITGSTVTAEVSIGKTAEGGFGLEVAISATIPNVDTATAQSLVEKAHQVCPYSNATRGNIKVELSVA